MWVETTSAGRDMELLAEDIREISAVKAVVGQLSLGSRGGQAVP